MNYFNTIFGLMNVCFLLVQGENLSPEARRMEMSEEKQISV